MANYKRSGGQSVGAKVFTGIVTFLLLAAIVLTGLSFGLGWIQLIPKEDPAQEQPGEEEAEGEMTVSNIVAQSMSLAVTPLSVEGTTATNGKTVSLTATVLPEGATDKTVTWSVSWQNASDSWASGKDVSDYVTLSDTTGETITVTNTQAFGEEIIVRANANGGDDVFATCELNFIKSISDVGLTVYNANGTVLSDYGYNSDENNDLSCPSDWIDDTGETIFSQIMFEFSYTIGTVEEDYSLTNMKINSYSFATVNNYENGDKINVNAITWYEIGDLFDLSPVMNLEDRRYLYENHPTAEFSVTIKGNTTGKTITKTFTIGFEFDVMYVKATGININQSTVNFY